MPGLDGGVDPALEETLREHLGIETGHQPSGKTLDVSNPPKGSSGVPHGPFKDDGGEDTNPPFVRDLTVPELEEVIEKCVRRVLDGKDIKREFERLQAEIKK